MKKQFILPQFVKVTNYENYKGFGNDSNLSTGTIHEVVSGDEKSISVKGLSREVKLYADEYSSLWPIGKNGKPKVGHKFTEEEIENFRKDFEKNRQESKNNSKFVSQNSNNKKQVKMAKEVKATVNSLTATETKVMEAIATVTGLEKDNVKLVGKKADLDKVAEDLHGVDVAKVSRKMKREGLITYEWSEDKEGARTGARSLAMTKEGFESFQLPVKVKAAPKAKKEDDLLGDKPKTEKKPAKTEKASAKSAKAEKATKEPYSAPGEAEEDILGLEEVTFNVVANAKAKKFTVTSQYGTHTIVAKTLAKFKELKDETEDGWLTRIENGELVEA